MTQTSSREVSSNSRKSRKERKGANASRNALIAAAVQTRKRSHAAIVAVCADIFAHAQASYARKTRNEERYRSKNESAWKISASLIIAKVSSSSLRRGLERASKNISSKLEVSRRI